MKNTLMFLVCSLLFTNVHGETYFQDTSISYLKGENYQLGHQQRTIVTFEYASAHQWGDIFLFADRSMPKQGDNNTYIEFSPRFKLTELNDNNFFKALYIATTWEAGTDFNNYLYGVGTTLNLNHFNFFKVNWYRKNNDLTRDNWQTTVSWALPVTLGNQQLLYDGFIDWTSMTTDQASSFNLTSQLKYNIKNLLPATKDLWIGIEYVYWNNKFGIKDINERNLNFLVKLHF